MRKHVYFPGWMLDKNQSGELTRRRANETYAYCFDRLNQLLLNQRLQAAVDHGLMQFGFSFEVLGPNTY